MDFETEQKFLLSKHVGYLLANLQQLPAPYAGQESNRLTLAYFAVVGLKMLDALDEGAVPEITEWVYSLQVIPEKGQVENGTCYGFRGSPSLGIPYSETGVPSQHQYDSANIAATYSALAILRSFGDDLSRVAREPILRTLQRLQQSDGSFGSVCAEAESDMRFVFCAAAICSILGDQTAIDVDAAVQFIHRSRGYSGGFGLASGLEAHGGATYCAVAALKLLERLPRQGNALGTEANGCGRTGTEGMGTTLEWCLQRQTSSGGLQGRANKDADTCYAFWVGASLEMLGGYSFLDRQSLRRFLFRCQNQKYGGFSKHPGELPDLLHTFYGICGLSLVGQDGLRRIDVSLGVPVT
ncbi:geranylgeranyl transferase beta subunit [Klebsormidium nitens]|uniref:Geranylgeranyl transferase type-1 subunit beta n=1 Tax=Klebsormidium nitens TaxID=105231 RepID=A0A1Y1HT01_KLENI|nr:geranylgeranyl transferase beta subunit [Klebsormidium nitens]|eukprot:GAQ78958.1 geranylgeranyl transferase beta subunit [Klebsormidium nitens]